MPLASDLLRMIYGGNPLYDLSSERRMGRYVNEPVQHHRTPALGEYNVSPARAREIRPQASLDQLAGQLFSTDPSNADRFVRNKFDDIEMVKPVNPYFGGSPLGPEQRFTRDRSTAGKVADPSQKFVKQKGGLGDVEAAKVLGPYTISNAYAIGEKGERQQRPLSPAEKLSEFLASGPQGVAETLSGVASLPYRMGQYYEKGTKQSMHPYLEILSPENQAKIAEQALGMFLSPEATKRAVTPPREDSPLAGGMRELSSWIPYVMPATSLPFWALRGLDKGLRADMMLP